MDELELLRNEIMNGRSTEPWEQWENESDTQFEYFMTYLNMKPSNRTMLGAANLYRKQNGREEKSSIPGSWIEAKKQFDWDMRTNAFDQYMKEEMKQYVEHQQYIELIQFRKQQRELSEVVTNAAFLLVRRAMEALEQLNSDDIRPATIANYIKTATQVADFASNIEAQSFALNKILNHIMDADDSGIESLIGGINFNELEELENEALGDIELIDLDDEEDYE